MPALKPLLSDPDPDVRLSSARALISLGAEGRVVLPVLLSFLDDPDQARRWWSCRLIAEIGPPGEPAVPALMRLLKDPLWARPIPLARGFRRWLNAREANERHDAAGEPGRPDREATASAPSPEPAASAPSLRRHRDQVGRGGAPGF
jgi:hypothetical protein